ncbi:MAG: A/G-specific adenine glycosylase [Frankia sp.]
MPVRQRAGAGLVPPAVADTAVADAVVAWYDVTARDLPWRRPGAEPWAVLVSEVMLQQTPVARVLPAYDAWLARWPSPAALAADPPGEAVRMWGRLGYPRRALRLHDAATVITERHNGQVPSDVETLLTLPGVGAYTARAVSAFAFRERHPVVDVNVRRFVARAVEGRAEGGPTVGPRDLATVADLLPADPGEAARASVAFMELGALVCVARSPRCSACPVHSTCAWRLAGSPPPSGPARRAQSYAGTDRQVRGRLLAVLRDARGPVAADDLRAAWDGSAQRARALGSLIEDGLVVPLAGGVFALPGEHADGLDGSSLARTGVDPSSVDSTGFGTEAGSVAVGTVETVGRADASG